MSETRTRRMIAERERELAGADRAAVQARIDPTELSFRLVWRRYLRGNELWTETDTDDLERPLFFTVTPGAYMDPACITLVVSGTPPRGVFVVMAGPYDPASWPVYVLHGKQPRVIDADGPENGRLLRRTLLDLIESRGIVESWKAEEHWQERYPRGEGKKTS